MFAHIVKATTLAALIAVGATAAATSQASAGQVQFGVTFGTPGYGPQWGSRPSWGAPRGYCQPRLAVNKARNLGVRSARIVGRDRNRIIVRGWRHGHRTRVVFANARRCPVVRFR